MSEDVRVMRGVMVSVMMVSWCNVVSVSVMGIRVVVRWMVI